MFTKRKAAEHPQKYASEGHKSIKKRTDFISLNKPIIKRKITTNHKCESLPESTWLNQSFLEREKRAAVQCTIPCVGSQAEKHLKHFGCCCRWENTPPKMSIYHSTCLLLLQALHSELIWFSSYLLRFHKLQWSTIVPIVNVPVLHLSIPALLHFQTFSRSILFWLCNTMRTLLQDFCEMLSRKETKTLLENHINFVNLK